MVDDQPVTNLRVTNVPPVTNNRVANVPPVMNNRVMSVPPVTNNRVANVQVMIAQVFFHQPLLILNGPKKARQF